MTSTAEFRPTKWQTAAELRQPTLDTHVGELDTTILTLIFTQRGANIIPVYEAMLNRWVRPVIAEHEARGYARGLAKAQAKYEAIAAQRRDQLWQDWLSRKTEAEEQGLPFDEPHPGIKRRGCCHCCNE